MLEETLKTDLEQIYAKIIDGTMQSKNHSRKTPLKDLTKLVRLFTDTHTCILTFVDLEKKQVQRIASSSQNQEFEI